MVDIIKVHKKFKETFGYDGETAYFSPGRINLIGEHTDYNGGHVFPCAISMGTYAVVAPRQDKFVYAKTGNFPELGILSFSLEGIKHEKESGWTNYLKGMLLYIQEDNEQLPHGFDLYIFGDIPNTGGLSSSASLEVLTAIIANDLYNLNLGGEKIARMGMRVENEFLNINTGIMDQFIIANALEGHAMFLDTNTLEFSQIPLDLSKHKILILNSLAQRELVDSEYNIRREQCEIALEKLQKVTNISSLGELTESEYEKYKYAIDDPLIEKRAKHAVYENMRVIQATSALKDNNIEMFGKLMNESHLSLHDNYEVTIPETDMIVRFAWELDGVIGARMTGGGFGGSCIAIVENDFIEDFIENLSKEYENEFNYKPEIYIANTADKAQKIK